MYYGKRFFVVIALVVGFVGCSVRAAPVSANAISDKSLAAVRVKLGAVTELVAWNSFLRDVNALISHAVTMADKTNVLTLFDTGTPNIGSVLTDRTKPNLCYSQDAYDAAKGTVAAMAIRFGVGFSTKFNQAASGNLYSKFARALTAPSVATSRSRRG